MGGADVITGTEHAFHGQGDAQGVEDAVLLRNSVLLVILLRSGLIPESQVLSISLFTDADHDDKKDATDDIGNVGEDVAIVFDQRGPDFALEVEVAQVQVSLLRSNLLIRKQQLNHRNGVEDADEQDDPKVER